jgi:hypothetical protein
VQLRETNGAVSLMALPLTLAMTINVLFVSGAVFVPGLWNVVEYLFPFAMAAFFAVGVLALRTFADIFGRAISNGHFDCARNNNLTQMQAAFAFAMVGVGLAAPAAMSTVKLTIESLNPRCNLLYHLSGGHCAHYAGAGCARHADQRTGN